MYNRTILKQVCESENVHIPKGIVSKSHIHVEYRPLLSVSDLVKRLKRLKFREVEIKVS
ncbi:hypothetical protein EYW44_06075 [Tenacibaculum sp. M341]|nr:hypothetical protein EYW44_06075 [Tenacibaculum sp. M341]